MTSDAADPRRLAPEIKWPYFDGLTYFPLSLYPALHRLEHQGWIQAEWKSSENNRRAKYYSLSAAGRRQLKSELANWHRLSGAIGLVIGAV